MELPRVLAARPSPLIAGTISTFMLRSRSSVRGSSENASSRAMIMHPSRDDGSLPCTLQLSSAAGLPETAWAVGFGAG